MTSITAHDCPLCTSARNKGHNIDPPTISRVLCTKRQKLSRQDDTVDELEEKELKIAGPVLSLSLSLFLSRAKTLASLCTTRASFDGNRMRVEGLTSESPREKT